MKNVDTNLARRSHDQKLKLMRARMGKTLALWVTDKMNDINDLPPELKDAAEQYLTLVKEGPE